jgi:serine/threonine protein kinase
VKHKITVSEEAKDLITKLLSKDRKERLGQKNDADEVLSHPFFNGIDFKLLATRKLPAEFKPELDESGLNNFDSEIINLEASESVVP